MSASSSATPTHRPTDAFVGQVVLVTGAAGGIGSAISRAFSAEGATVAAVDLIEAPLHDLATTVPRLVPYAADLSDEASASAAVDAVERELGPITACVHAAGVLSAAAVTTTTTQQWRRVFAVNADGTFHICRAIAQAMIPRRRGASLAD
ncbi:SDR family NAD(P)-dependent oxidoreductase [Nonomuraea jabiensis]|uniref:SDR family NAD(P)-dependent oxidoreductase n=1 Tax=Nonomuraea jabiensis TaxID=882448 RepID=UPI003D73ADBB